MAINFVNIVWCFLHVNKWYNIHSSLIWLCCFFRCIKYYTKAQRRSLLWNMLTWSVRMMSSYRATRMRLPCYKDYRTRIQSLSCMTSKLLSGVFHLSIVYKGTVEAWPRCDSTGPSWSSFRSSQTPKVLQLTPAYWSMPHNDCSPLNGASSFRSYAKILTCDWFYLIKLYIFSRESLPTPPVWNMLHVQYSQLKSTWPLAGNVLLSHSRKQSLVVISQPPAPIPLSEVHWVLCLKCPALFSYFQWNKSVSYLPGDGVWFHWPCIFPEA